MGEENGNPLQYSCLENPMDPGACWTKVRGVAKDWDTTEQLTHSHKYSLWDWDPHSSKHFSLKNDSQFTPF